MISSLSGPRSRRWTVVASLVCVVGLAAWTPVGAHAATSGGTEVRPFEPGIDGQGLNIPPKSNAPSHVPAVNVPRPTPLSVTSDDTSKRSEGLSLKDQRTSNGGNSFSLEPPDQALCVGDTEVIEGVNNVFATYSKNGGPATSGPQSYDPFWNNGAAEIVRTATPPTFGPFVSDPKCYWDPDLKRFYMTELQLGTVSATGAFDGNSFVNIAVSTTDTPQPPPRTGTSTGSTFATTGPRERRATRDARAWATSRSSAPINTVSTSPPTSSPLLARPSTARRSTRSTRLRSPREP